MKDAKYREAVRLYGDDARAVYQEGQDAAERNRSIDACPYTFDRAKVSPADFERGWRWKLDAWFWGWHSWLTERGLGYNFKPLRTNKRAEGLSGE